jgi:hypothetical protein
MPTVNIELLLALTGCVALLAGLFGGGFKAEQVEIPKISGVSRILSGVIGLALIGGASWLYVHPSTPSAPQPTEAAKSGAESSPESPTLAATTPPPATAPATPTPTLVGAATLPPFASTISPDPKTPEGTLSLFFSELSQGVYNDAWSKLTLAYQVQNYHQNFNTFKSQWKKYKSIDLNSAQVARNGNSADCTADETFHYASGAMEQKSGIAWHLTFDVTKQVWMIDVP